MKNLKKLSREQLHSIKAGSIEGRYTCHFIYTGTLWGDDMVITSVGEGACPKSKGCYSYTQTSPKCEK